MVPEPPAFVVGQRVQVARASYTLQWADGTIRAVSPSWAYDGRWHCWHYYVTYDADQNVPAFTADLPVWPTTNIKPQSPTNQPAQPMTADENRRLHLLLKECGMDDAVKKSLVYQFSDERCTSSKELTAVEATALLRYLQDEHSKRCKPMRGKIIHYLCLLGYVDSNDRPDWDRINAFIVGIGTNNPRKVILNYLYYSELPKLVSQVEAMYKHELKRLNK